MDGVIRWRDLQNILPTEQEINLLEGLTAIAADINRITGFLGTGTDLNGILGVPADLANHLADDLSTAHPLVPGTLDGGVLANGTVGEIKLDFTPMTSLDALQIENDFTQVDADIAAVDAQVQNLYSIVIPGQGSDIADSIAQFIDHLEKLEDAHDATAISLGNEYTPIIDTLTGSFQAQVPLDKIKYFKAGDDVELQSTAFGPEANVVDSVNYNTGHIGLQNASVGNYLIANTFVIKNLTQDEVQEGIDRSLRNTTDIFSGRLTIEQDSLTDNALDINNTGSGYSLWSNAFTAQTGNNYTIELNNNNDSSYWELQDSDKRVAAQITDQGNAWVNTVALEDRTSLFKGTITKQSLTADQTWTFPDRSGYVGIGDLTFTELLKVRCVDATKNITIAPGTILDYEGEAISAWIDMEFGSSYAGSTINLETQFTADSQLLGLGSNYQCFVVYITDIDTVFFDYGPKEAVEQDAMDNYVNNVPSAFMKLAKMTIQGDGAGGILQSSITKNEDMRPFLTQGMATAYYDEEIEYPSGFSSGGIINLPANSRAAGADIHYKTGESQLEVYIDGVYQRATFDYDEHQGNPVAQIRMLKDVQPNSNVRFRITYKAAAIGGGLTISDSLQQSYNGGNDINLSLAQGPITMQSLDMDTLLEVNGHASIDGLIQALQGLEFATQAAFPGDNTNNHLWVDSNNDLIFHQYDGTATEWNLLEEISQGQKSVIVEVTNNTGSLISKGRGLALHASLTNHVVLCDTSNSLSTSRLAGISFENIPNGSTGRMIMAGCLPSAGLALPHKTVIVVDPRNPGLLVDVTLVDFLIEDVYMEAGQLDGSTLLVDIDRNAKDRTVWAEGIAGESFAPLTTKLVRLGLNGETVEAAYKAEKANADADQKFWALAAVHPVTAKSALDGIKLYREVNLGTLETPFAAQDIGLPLYLADDGDFLPWRLIKGTYSAGDAIVKVGMIRAARKFIIDSVQVMGTASGPMV